MKDGHGKDGELGAVATAKRTFSIPSIGLVTVRTGWGMDLPPGTKRGQAQIADLFLRAEANELASAAVQKKQVAIEVGGSHKVLGRLQDSHQAGLRRCFFTQCSVRRGQLGGTLGDSVLELVMRPS